MSQYTPAGPPYDPATGQPYPAPVPPKQRSWFVRHKVLTGLGAFVVLVVVISALSQGGSKTGADAQGLEAELVAAVRTDIGAVACLKQVDVVHALPKTRSGKILRKTMRGIAEGRDEPLPSTIEDPAVIDKLHPVLRTKK